jgi:hypothetical protein
MAKPVGKPHVANSAPWRGRGMTEELLVSHPSRLPNTQESNYSTRRGLKLRSNEQQYREESSGFLVNNYIFSG